MARTGKPAVITVVGLELQFDKNSAKNLVSEEQRVKDIVSNINELLQQNQGMVAGSRLIRNRWSGILISEEDADDKGG